MPKTVNPAAYGRRPNDAPTVSREEVDARQARALNQTKNGELEDGKSKPFVTPHRSQTDA